MLHVAETCQEAARFSAKRSAQCQYETLDVFRRQAHVLTPYSCEHLVASVGHQNAVRLNIKKQTNYRARFRRRCSISL